MSVIAAHASDIKLEPAPIRADWIMAGAPFARATQISASVDADSFTCIWDCTAGEFRWDFDCDETVHIIEGAVTVRSGSREFALQVGDTAYFPAGTTTVWNVGSYVRKVAFLRLPPPRPVSFALRALRKIRRMLGIGAVGGGLQPQAG